MAIRLRELITFTQKIGSKVFAVGKIILLKIIEFVKVHPRLVTGIGLGVAIGAAVQFLVNTVPFIGLILAPLAGALTAAFGIVIFGIAGHRLDKRDRGKELSSGIIGIAEDIVEIAQAFFEFIADVFNTVFKYLITASNHLIN
ncbi:MAG: hypothetical protein QNJ54_02065 [Prochloraceae cyanobacterium]|nr:hypothetical protein [Prochloraceae cyanobacterium]